MIKNKKGAMEFSFAWIFAIIAGAIILSLAIYGVVKFMKIQGSEIDAQTAMGIGVLLNPLESGFEDSKRVLMEISTDTRIYTGCSNDSIFGRQTITTSQKLSGEWSNEGVNVPFQNRYIFSKNPVQGKDFYVFSKPFEMPFKIADLIYVTSTEDKYCFVNPPGEIEDEIKLLIGENVRENENFILESRKVNCPSESTQICFDTQSGCDIYVNRNLRRVQRSSETVWYEGDALMYAAIFSNKKDYECQIDRLMNRTEQIYEIYQDKAEFILKKTNCDSQLDVEIMRMINLLINFQDSEDLSVISDMSEEIEKKNKAYPECRLWY
jgi:hypothetical protein